jgi:eukaryotic-like serine/threonine-protein kinase
MALYIPEGRRIQLGSEPLGSGAEGEIFRLTDTSDLCAKLYFTPGPAVRKRLEALMRLPTAARGGDNREHLHAAMPASVLVDGDDLPRGFLMPLIDGVPSNILFNSRQRLDVLDAPTWRTVIAVAARIARMFAVLHRDDIVVGDVSPTNIIVSPQGHVTLIDCDTCIPSRPPSTARRRRPAGRFSSPAMTRSDLRS